MDQQFYIGVCGLHKMHNDECSACRRFDKALTEKLSHYVTPPQQHPVVTGPIILEWIGRIFPIDKS